MIRALQLPLLVIRDGSGSGQPAFAAIPTAGLEAAVRTYSSDCRSLTPAPEWSGTWPSSSSSVLVLVVTVMVRISIPNIRVNINNNSHITKLSKASAVEKLVNFLSPRATAVLTGAGVSVDSGIRPYRGQDGRYMNPNYQSVFLYLYLSHLIILACRPILVSRIHWRQPYLNPPSSSISKSSLLPKLVSIFGSSSLPPTLSPVLLFYHHL